MHSFLLLLSAHPSTCSWQLWQFLISNTLLLFHLMTLTSIYWVDPPSSWHGSNLDFQLCHHCLLCMEQWIYHLSWMLEQIHLYQCLASLLEVQFWFASWWENLDKLSWDELSSVKISVRSCHCVQLFWGLLRRRNTRTGRHKCDSRMTRSRWTASCKLAFCSLSRLDRVLAEARLADAGTFAIIKCFVRPFNWLLLNHWSAI